VTLEEYDKKLRELSDEEFKKFNHDFGGGQKTIEERLREFTNNPTHERRICQLLGLKTEGEKLTEATIKSSEAAFKSAHSARLSLYLLAAAVIVALAPFAWSVYLKYHQYDDLKATILGASPIPGTLCTADIVFTNNGNRQCSIAAVNLIESYTVKTDANDSHTAESIIPFSNQRSFTIKPNDVISKQFIISGKGNIRECGFTGLKEGEEREWRLGFCVVDSNGKYHIIKVPVFWITVGEKDMRVIKYPLVVKLLPSPSAKDTSLALPLIGPSDR